MGIELQRPSENRYYNWNYHYYSDRPPDHYPSGYSSNRYWHGNDDEEPLYWGSSGHIDYNDNVAGFYDDTTARYHARSYSSGGDGNYYGKSDPAYYHKTAM